jgi:hypothetical protein
MTLISLAQACRLLALDPKTLRGWLAQAHVPLQPHPTDARSKVVTAEHLRQVAAAHRRTLPELPEALPASVAASQPPPLSADLLEGLATLAALSAQVVVVQQRLAELTQMLSCVAVAPSPSPEEPTEVRGASTSAPAAPRPRPAASSSAKQLPKPAHILPLVEYGTDGGYVVICPKHGLLTLEPDSPQWFAWLATQSSFRFVGRSGRLTAHREVQRLPKAAWRAHRQIRNHTYNVRLGSTESLTIAALEQAAAALQAHLT